MDKGREYHHDDKSLSDTPINTKMWEVLKYKMIK